MTKEEAREAVYQHFVTLWANRLAFCFDNEPFDPPGDAPWVRLSVRHLSRRQISLGQPGNRRWEYQGQAIIQYFERPGDGLVTQDGHTDRLEAIFEGVSLGGTTIKFNSATTQELGTVENGRWAAAVTRADFTYEAIK